MKYKAFPLLLATTFLSTNAIAQTVPTIDAKYLNQYTSPDITWEEVATSGDDIIEIKTGGTTKYFKYKYTTPEGREVYDNQGKYGGTDITADFINYAWYGYGAINNHEQEQFDILGNFINNRTAIYNDYHGSIIGNIQGNFVDNNLAVINFHEEDRDKSSIIDLIEGVFIGNSRAIYNYASNYDNYNAIIKKIAGVFIANSNINSDRYYAVVGGAINNAFNWNDNKGTINSIKGDFISNSAINSQGEAFGGAIYNGDTIGEIVNSNFIDNYVSGTSAEGGAIYSINDLNIIADNGTSLFSGNKANGNSNAIYMKGSYDSYKALNLKAINNGLIVFDDAISGDSYDININGDLYTDNNNGVRFNNTIRNVHDFTIDKTQVALGKNAVIYIVNNYIAKNSPYLQLDIDITNFEAGKLYINKDLVGTTNIIVNVLQSQETIKKYSIVNTLSNQSVTNENGIPFAIAPNHTLSEEEAQKSFEVYRVIGSPYMWEVNYDTTDKEWSLYSTAEENPYKPEEDNDNQNEDENKNENDSGTVAPTPQPLGPIEVAPEVIGFESLTSSGLAQTNGMVYNIMRKVGVNRLFCPGCGFYDYNWDGEAFHNAWVDTTYNGLTIEAPVEIEAKVWGIEAGSDIQHDLNNKLGIFASYRQGNYEMNGKGEKYYSTIGSEIDIDSYLAGLYYRYDHNNWYAFATAYAGMQSAEIKTDDGISADTDGLELGGSIEGGYSYALSRTLSVTPSLGVFYSQINYDDATDSAGKTVEYNDLKQVELEAGAKFAHTQYTDDGFYSLYIKPSVVQTLVDGDEIDVTELGKVDTVEDKTLGRIEIGGNYGFNDNWSAYGWANYTFGSDYEATSLGAGLNYAW